MIFEFTQEVRLVACIEPSFHLRMVGIVGTRHGAAFITINVKYLVTSSRLDVCECVDLQRD